MKRFISTLSRWLKRLITLPIAIVVKGFAALFSLAVTLLSIPAVRGWLWDKMKDRTKKKVIDIEGRVKKKAKKHLGK